MSSPRHDALQIFRAALAAADPERAILSHVTFDGRALTAGKLRYRLSNFDRIQVIGAGKATAAMASALEKLLGRRITSGLINVPRGTASKLRRIEVNPSGHPIPDRSGAAGAARILQIASRAGPSDLLICAISGGASALLPAPSPPLTLAAKQKITGQLLASGATIHEMNTVRKHLSEIKGGQLAQAAWPATVLTLLLSDVVGDNPEVIGSGPTVPDPSTIADAQRILARYKIQTPQLHETPKELSNANHVIVGSNRQALAAAATKARQLGYRTQVLSTTIEGETRDIASMHAAIAREILSKRHRPTCLLSGGETTVTIRGNGKGGRNQEFVLAAALALNGAPVTILSAGTDGIDGPTDAAGAIADETTLSPSAQTFLDNNDSYNYFAPLGALLKTGPTGTNVMDIHILLIP